MIKIKSLFALAFCFSGLFFAPPLLAAETAVLFIINGTGSAEPSTSLLAVGNYTYSQFMETDFSPHPFYAQRMAVIKSRLSKPDLANKEVRITFTQDERGATLTDIEFRSGEAVVTLPIGKALPGEDATEVADADGRWATLQAARREPTEGAAVKAAVLWVLDASPEALRCEHSAPLSFLDARTQALFSDLRLSEVKDRDRAEVVQAIVNVVGSLSRSQRLRLFARKDNPCLGLLAHAWRVLLRDRRPYLVRDFKGVLETVYAAKAQLPFSGEIEAHVVPKGGELGTQLRYLQELLLELKTAEFYEGLPAKFRDWATTDTNTPNIDSRMEPIDLLSFFMARNHLASELKHTDHDALSRISLAKGAIQHVLFSEVYPATVMVRKAKAVRPEGSEDTYVVYCAGDRINVGKGAEHLHPKHSRLVDELTFSRSALVDLRKRSAVEYFTCGFLSAALTNPEEPLRVPLVDPGATGFTIGEDHKIKAVVSFQLVGAISDDYLLKLKLGTLFQGYRPVEESKVGDLRKEFFEEMRDTDFYFPTNHSTDSSYFYVGYEGGTKLRLQKTVGKNTAEMVLFIPPANAQGLPGIVRLGDGELATFFQERRKLPVTRRLNVINLRCQSNSCRDDWMRYYKLSFEEKLTEAQAQKLANELAPEVPIVIGAGRSFATNSLQELVAHSRYPFKAVDLALEEKPVTELVDFLKGNSFNPVTSIGQDLYFSVDAQRDRVNVSVVLNNGVRVFY